MPDRNIVIKGLECCMPEHICRGCPYQEKGECEDGVKSIEDAIALLKEQPEIIRCKDCKHGADTVINGEYLFKTCGGVNHEPDWFCADGKRR